MNPLKIRFMPNSEQVDNAIQGPRPARNYVPKWYRDIPVFKPHNPQFNSVGDGTSEALGRNVKSCVPFLDALTGGYIQETWTDIHVAKQDEQLHIHQALMPEIFSARDNVSLPLGDEYYPIEFVWKTPYRVVLPKGWSLLVTHPFNRLDLPFTTLTGIIDSDVFHHATFGNMPFHIKSNFEGLIPAGTPMFQLLPIYRADWDSEALPFDKKELDRLHAQMYKKFWGHYRDKFWHKKTYN